MGRARFGWLSIGLSTLVLVGCGDGTPPLDELPLRDTLRADPAVVAALGDSARQRLAARFEAAVTDDAVSDAVAEGPTPANEVRSLDEARGRRAADALVMGVIADGVARPAGVGAGAQTPLPELEGEVATNTAALEARALDGAAGARLRALLTASGARRLERVVGWPAGAVAIGETIYVDASWLVALAPLEGGVSPDAGDGGISGSPAAVGAGAGSTLPGVVASSSPIALAASAASFDGGCPPDAFNCSTFDAGTFTSPPPPSQPPPPPPPPPGPSFWDACAAGSGCAASSDSCDSSDGEDDSCSGTDDGSDSSCSGTDDGSSDSCSTPPDDGSDCRVSPGRERPRAATIVWVLAPLGFLIGRRR